MTSKDRVQIAGQAHTSGWVLCHGSAALEHYQRGRHEAVIISYSPTGTVMGTTVTAVLKKLRSPRTP